MAELNLNKIDGINNHGWIESWERGILEILTFWWRGFYTVEVWKVVLSHCWASSNIKDSYAVEARRRFHQKERVWRLPKGERCLKERKEFENYPKVKVFQWEKRVQILPEGEDVLMRETCLKTTWRKKCLLVVLDHWDADQGLKEPEGLPHCGSFRFLDLLNSGIQCFGKDHLLKMLTLLVGPDV